MLSTYRTCNSTIGFSKYKFYNKLLGDITLLRVTPSVTWTQPIYIYIYIYYTFYLDANIDKFTIILYYLCIFFMLTKF